MVAGEGSGLDVEEAEELTRTPTYEDALELRRRGVRRGFGQGVGFSVVALGLAWIALALVGVEFGLGRGPEIGAPVFSVQAGDFPYRLVFLEEDGQTPVIPGRVVAVGVMEDGSARSVALDWVRYGGGDPGGWDVSVLPSGTVWDFWYCGLHEQIQLLEEWEWIQAPRSMDPRRARDWKRAKDFIRGAPRGGGRGAYDPGARRPTGQAPD